MIGSCVSFRCKQMSSRQALQNCSSAQEKSQKPNIYNWGIHQESTALRAISPREQEDLVILSDPLINLDCYLLFRTSLRNTLSIDLHGINSLFKMR